MRRAEDSTSGYGLGAADLGAWRERRQPFAEGGFAALERKAAGDVSQANVETILRGYRAFTNGDLEAIESLLDPQVEWVGQGEVSAIADRADVLDILRERVSEEYQVTVDRCLGVGDEVVVSMRFSRVELDATDERPLQSRRSFLVGRYAAVVTIADGRVARVVEYPHLAAALDAVGVQDDNP